MFLPKKNRFEKGATSIYVVVIASLLFSVITVSFIRIIINETAKTTNDELAQSAYDSALAGVEDTKSAIKKYYECVASNAGDDTENCSNVKKYIEAGFDYADNKTSAEYAKCDSVSLALQRISGENKLEEVLVQESTSNTSENIIQAYTCISIDRTLNDYSASLGSAGSTMRVIQLKAEDPDIVTGIRISWHSDKNAESGSTQYTNKDNFPPVANNNIAIPPTISAQIIQTAESFTLGEFTSKVGDGTNRGTVFLVPSNDGNTHVPQKILLDSNDHSYEREESTINQPQKINCEKKLVEGYKCTASIELPLPVAHNGNTKRNSKTFFLVLSLPYGQPTTSFSIQMCTDTDSVRGDCIDGNGKLSITDFKDAQIAVDATGRANDMYSRVEARIEFNDIYFPYPEFVLQATGNGDESIKKNFYVTENCFKTDENGNIFACNPDDNNSGQN